MKIWSIRLKKEKMRLNSKKRRDILKPMATPKDKQKVALRRWLARAKASLETGDGSNLLDRHYEPKSKLIVDKEVYT